MNKNQLAKALKARQVKLGLHSKKVINQITSEQIIHDYVHCSRCFHCIFEDSEAAIKTSSSIQEFIDLCNMALAAHVCKFNN